jgi:HK97 family phage prohead protease
MKFELLSRKVELRANNENDSMTVSGYVNKTGELSEVLGSGKQFVEKIAPGAFTRAISKNPQNIDFLAEHNNKNILASTRNGSLKLSEDATGLYMEATISPTTWGHDYYQLIDDGILQNMSFGFRTLDDSWESRGDGVYERTINDLELIEVSVVRNPAYSQSTISARGIEVIEDIEIPLVLEEEQRNMDELKEILKGFEERFAGLEKSLEEFRSEQREREEKAAEERAKVQGADPEKDAENSGSETEVEVEKKSAEPKVDEKEKPDDGDEKDKEEKSADGDEEDELDGGADEDKEEKSLDGEAVEGEKVAKEKKRSLVSEELSELRNKLSGLTK